MNSVESVWSAGVRDSDGAGEGAEVIQVVLSWCDAGDKRRSTVLGVREVRSGETLALGERGELMVPEEVLCADRAEIVRFDGERATAHRPPGGTMLVDGWPRDERTLEIASGHLVEITVGAFVARITRGHAATRPAGAPLEALERSGFGAIAGSALVHAAVFTAIAFIAPSLGATEEDPLDRDRILLMQALLDASSQHEQEIKPDDGAKPNDGDASPGAQTRGAEGEAGKPTAENKNARWSARRSATPENVTLARDNALKEAAGWGVIGLLPAQSVNAPTVPWGTVLNGSDDDNKIGHLFGGTLDDAYGTGGWGLSGPGEGSGGIADAIGLGGNGIGGLGGMGRHCVGPNCSGIGNSSGRSREDHVSRARFPREAGPVTTNGHLPAAVIQRIVRQNFGRFNFCYQNGLKSNPNLEGRVSVRFVIGRDGAVQFAADGGGSDIPDAAVRQCVVSSFTNLSFPPPDSGMVTVVYPLMFTPM
jgi:hypothetical protein